jgi:hypothetical protein
MEMEVHEETGSPADLALARLTAAATQLEEAAARFNAIELQAATSLQASLEERLREAEATIAQLRAESATRPAALRRIPPSGVATLAAREGSPADPAALDAALRSLSLEQRIAVKSELLRAGLLS